ncbi:MAG: hypothetical protein U1E89_10280 [Burkholderiaceae bacterium]
MGSLWRDSVHGALCRESGDDASEATRATALLLGIDPLRASALVRSLSPLARTRLASDLAHALEMARELQPDLIIAGADVGGSEVGVALRAFEADLQLQEIPVIVLASSDDDSTRISAMRGGALAWLPHTADTEALLARVRLAVRMRRNTLLRAVAPRVSARS